MPRIVWDAIWLIAVLAIMLWAQQLEAKPYWLLTTEQKAQVRAERRAAEARYEASCTDCRVPPVKYKKTKRRPKK